MIAKRPRTVREPTPVTADELEAALDLLKREEDVLADNRRRARTDFLRLIAIGCSTFALPVGVFVVFFEPIKGAVLLTIGVLALTLFGRMSSLDRIRKVGALRAAVSRSEVSDAAAALWLRRNRMEVTLSGLIAAALYAAFGIGLVWLAKSAFADGQIPVLSLLLMGGATILFWTWFAFYMLRQYRYYSLVTDARGRLEARSTAADAKPENEIALMPEEIEILSHAEEQAFDRQVKAAVAKAPDVLDDAYAISIDPAVHMYLDKLAEQSPDAWHRVLEAIQGLQFDPHPPDSKPDAASDTLEIQTQVGKVDYAVEPNEQRIRIVSFEEEREVDDA
jgi:hypothetical protein